MAKADLSILYKAIGFAGEDKEALAQIKPLASVAEGREITVFDMLDELISSSQFGAEADALWDAVCTATKMKGVSIPEGTDRALIRAKLVCELNAGSGARSNATVMEELRSCPAVAREDSFI